ncbi:MAG: molybdopterin-dependent oxidoreductase, partial [Gammaproteobacteria bacterium]|nr:molybdopterin-dependent oxidoreductase [Gammaproteobacteria bacterium]
GTFTNTDRRVQLGRQAIPPPGEARQDLDIIIDMACRLGLDWRYRGAPEVFEEMRSVMPSIAGISWSRLQADGAVTYPCREPGDAGEAVLFSERFPRPGGRARLVAADFAAADELPDDEFPMVLITGRQLEHWHTGAMTRRASVLDALEPSPVATLNPQQLARLGIEPGQAIRIRSRRGEVMLTARVDPGLQPMQVFLPFCYHEAAANLLTNEALDPDGKIPEFKFCAVQCLPAD